MVHLEFLSHAALIWQELSESSELRVAGQVRERLHLSHLTPHQVRVIDVYVGHWSIQVLSYLKSPKGFLGKTAGCFSLLAKDATTQLQPAALPDQMNIENAMKMGQNLCPSDASFFAHGGLCQPGQDWCSHVKV